MFTSRAEHRLLLRDGSADARLTPLGRELGLVSQKRWEVFQARQAAIRQLERCLRETRLRPTPETGAWLKAQGLPETDKTCTLAEYLQRPEVNLKALGRLPEAAFSGLGGLAELLAAIPDDAADEAEVSVKYAGYLRRQEELAARSARLENQAIPEDMVYQGIPGLSAEAVEKLSRIRPATLGQAGRISGVTPAAVA